MYEKPETVARRLNAFNRWRLAPSAAPEDWDRVEERILEDLEGRFLERERANVRDAVREAPRNPRMFLEWFERLEKNGPGQHDPLFRWLADEASKQEMTWFFQQEVAGEAGFDDLVALTQVKLPARPKLELARNYWDEMGQGTPGGMHGPMLARLADELGIGKPNPDEVVWESLALANLMLAVARPRFAYLSVGALGVIELTAPGRAALVNQGLRRLGIEGHTRQYYALHATLDVKHSLAWIREVIRPLVEADSRIAPLIAEGALLRLHAGARCFDRYREELGVCAAIRAA